MHTNACSWQAVGVVEINYLLTKLLGAAEKITSSASSEIRLLRWTVFQNRHYKVYLDRCFDQQSIASQDYPDRFISFGTEKSEAADDSAQLYTSDHRSSWMVLIGRP